MTQARLLLAGDAGRVRPQAWSPQSLAEHRAAFPEARADGLIEALERAGLRGRGGAGFPTARKWRSVGDNGAPSAVIANGEEGEPLSWKDRYLLLRRPHLVLDGLELARAALGAERAVVYVSSVAAGDAVAVALAERGTTRVELVRVAPAYVAGEETSVVAALNGGPPIPAAKPPRPDQAGVGGRPTLVQNVETLAHVAWIARHGADRFRELGRGEERGTFLATVGMLDETPSLLEAPFGTALRDLLHQASVEPADIRAVLAGGYFGGLLRAGALDEPLTHARLAELGSGLGCGAFTVLGPEHCPVHAAASVLRYFADQSSGQCGACVRGTAAMADALQRVAGGSAEPGDLDDLRRWSASLRGRGACGLLDGATIAAATLLERFPEAVADHLDDRCPLCPHPLSGRTVI